MKKIFLILFLFTMLLLTFCKPKYREVTILFSTATGVTEGTSVVRNGVTIGKVSLITTSEKGASVAVSIDSKYSDNLVSASGFLVNKVDNNIVIEYHIFNSDSPPLKKGKILQGVTSKIGLILLKGQYIASQELNELYDYLKQVEGDIDSIKESEEFKKMLESIEKNLDESLKLGKKGSEMLLKEIAPIFRKKVADLRREIEKQMEN